MQLPDRKINRYKFRANNGWEEPTTINANGSNDRWWDATTTGDSVLPLVFYRTHRCAIPWIKTRRSPYSPHHQRTPQPSRGHALTKPGMEFTSMVNPAGRLADLEFPVLPRAGQQSPGSDYCEYTVSFRRTAAQSKGQIRHRFLSATPATSTTKRRADNSTSKWIRTTNTTYVMTPVEFGTNYASTRCSRNSATSGPARPPAAMFRSLGTAARVTFATTVESHQWFLDRSARDRRLRAFTNVPNAGKSVLPPPEAPEPRKLITKPNR